MGTDPIPVFIPASEGNTYLPEVNRIMRSPGAEHNIELSVYEFDVDNRFATADEGVQILQPPVQAPPGFAGLGR